MYFEGASNTKCPYYIRESAYSISCEGLEKGTVNVIKFPSEDKKIRFQKRCCYHIGRPCIAAQLLNERYIGN